MRHENDPKKTQHKYMPLRMMLMPMPKESGNSLNDIRALKDYVERLTVAVEYALEHLTIQQFADGELEQIGGE